MSQNKKLEELEKAITRFYEGYSAKRVALATFIVGVVSIFSSLAVYSWTNSPLLSALVALAVGFIAINVAFLTIVPPALSLHMSKDLICGAIKDPSRIKALDMQKVQLVDSKGKTQTLGAREMGVWSRLVVPYLIKCQAEGQSPVRKKSSRTLTASERRYIEERRKEVLEIEKKIKEDRKKLDADRKEVEARSADLKQAEDVVIARLTGVEQAEAELEQLKIAAAERANQSDAGYDKVAAEAKAAELRAKESELAKLKEHLAKDRRMLDQQKAEMQRLKESITKAPFPQAKGGNSPAEMSLKEREAALLERQREVEKAATDLEKRANFVTDSENSLIERLDALTEREAHVEQSEINAGIKED
jgi:hypothetical protein